MAIKGRLHVGVFGGLRLNSEVQNRTQKWPFSVKRGLNYEC